MGFQLTYLYLTLTNSKGQSQGRAHLAVNILEMVTWHKLLLSSNSKSHIGFQFSYLHLILAHSNCHSQGHADS